MVIGALMSEIQKTLPCCDFYICLSLSKCQKGKHKKTQSWNFEDGSTLSWIVCSGMTCVRRWIDSYIWIVRLTSTGEEWNISLCTAKHRAKSGLTTLAISALLWFESFLSHFEWQLCSCLYKFELPFDNLFLFSVTEVKHQYEIPPLPISKLLQNTTLFSNHFDYYSRIDQSGAQRVIRRPNAAFPDTVEPQKAHLVETSTQQLTVNVPQWSYVKMEVGSLL